MKATLKSTLCLLIISIGSFALFSHASEVDCRIPNGRAGWPVVFEDTGLSLKEKQAIIDDYRSICSQLSPQGSCETKTLEGNRILRMKYGVERWHIPEAIDGHFGVLLVTKNGSEEVFIDRVVSDAYKKSFAYMNAHREAYDCLPAFVNLMNNLQAENFPKHIDEILFFAKDAKQFSDEVSRTTIKQFVEAYNKYSYELTSILDFGEYDGLPMASLKMTQKGDGNLVDYFVAVFEDGRWKMLIYAGLYI